jgi:MoaA/NifB/PqqE/SkfB family radical SAM enzyme
MNKIRGLLNNEVFLSEIFQAFPNLADNITSFFLNRQTLGGPTFLSWVLTYNCPLSCRHCYIQPRSDILSKDDRLKIAKKIGQSSVYWVSLIGGEPLITPEIMDIAKILKKEKKKVTITTNGLFLNNFIQEIIDLDLDAIQISVDSHKKEQHDYLRNSPGLFENVLKSVIEIRKKRKSSKPFIKLRCTLSRENYLEVINYVRFWKDKADAIYFQPVVDNIMNRVRESEILFRKEEESSFRKVFSELQKEFASFSNLYYNFMPDYIFHREQLWRKLKFKCILIPASALYILPDGNTAVCYGRRDKTGGNLINKSIKEIWRSKEVKALQDDIKNKHLEGFDRECFCWEPYTLPNLYLLSLYNFISKVIGKKWKG